MIEMHQGPSAMLTFGILVVPLIEFPNPLSYNKKFEEANKGNPTSVTGLRVSL